MERGQIVKEYFELREYLNRANKISNLTSKLEFKIEQIELFEYQLCAIIQSKFETHRLALSIRDKRKIWERTGFTRFQILEEYCAKILNKFQENNVQIDRSIKISDLVTERMERAVQDKLKMLLLNKNYEP